MRKKLVQTSAFACAVGKLNDGMNDDKAFVERSLAAVIFEFNLTCRTHLFKLPAIL